MRVQATTQEGRALAVRGLTIGWPGRVLARGLDLDLDPGSITAVLGANGAGKSTLLATLAGLHPALGGSIEVEGVAIAALAERERAQRLAWLGSRLVRPLGMTVRELVALGRTPHTGWDGRLGVADHAIVDWALHEVGAELLAGRAAGELSDGELQRVAIARVLAQEPHILLLDEPSSHLDASHRHQLEGTLRRAARERSTAVVVASHDLTFALGLADQLVVVGAAAGAEGELLCGVPEDLGLRGFLDRELGGPGLHLDPASLRFVGPAPSGGSPIALVGESGPRRAWTERALVRCGYVLDQDARDRVELTNDRPSGGWVLPDGAKASSIRELVRLLGRAP